MQLNKLVEMSRKYGADANYVLAGGGNTSYKNGEVMAVKASGSALGTIDETGFVFMDVQKLRDMPGNTYPEDNDAREAEAIKDMMGAKLPGQADKRPSVESILHALFHEAYVLHLHPALVNGMTCGVDGAEAAHTLFAGTALWVPLTKPGFILSRVCRQMFDEFAAEHGKTPDIVFLQNHGLFVAADTTEEIDEKMKAIMKTLAGRIQREPDMALLESKDLAGAHELEGFASPAVTKEILAFAKSAQTMTPLMRPFTPDHIVYCKPAPLYAESIGELGKAYEDYKSQRGYAPRVAVIKDMGAYGLGDNEKAADTAIQVFMDGVRIAVYSCSFGGPVGLDDEFTDFIVNWEIESYRAKKSLSGA